MVYNKNMKRVFLVVIDGFGVGEAPDADKYGDTGSNTLLNIQKIRPMNLPNLTKLGLLSIDGINLHGQDGVIGSYGKMEEKSVGKDTTTGHFEMMGIISKYGMPTYPNGFPKEIVKQLEKAWGIGILGNIPASGTEIIKVLGEEHLKTKKPIVYTSADSVLQVATHTDIYPVEKLYEMCAQARKIMHGENAVGRIIARPFYTENGKFVRLNTGRRDFALPPEKPNTMSKLIGAKKDVIAVGKIEDIFNHESITKSYPNHTNKESLEVFKKLTREPFDGLCFVNLVDTDMVYGHRNDVEGYAKALEEIDGYLGEVLPNLYEDDYLVITGDHGCDPTTPSSDHSREYTSCLVYSKSNKKVVNFGTLKGFDNLGRYIEKLFGISDNSVIYDKLN